MVGTRQIGSMVEVKNTHAPILIVEQMEIFGEANQKSLEVKHQLEICCFVLQFLWQEDLQAKSFGFSSIWVWRVSR